MLGIYDCKYSLLSSMFRTGSGKYIYELYIRVFSYRVELLRVLLVSVLAYGLKV
jgi:hypothetical protein